MSMCQHFGVSFDGVDPAEQIGLEVTEVDSPGLAALAAAVHALNLAAAGGDMLAKHLQSSLTCLRRSRLA